MQLLTLRAAAILLGVCEPIARRMLAGYAVMVGSRKRYPLSAVERVASRGTGALPRSQAAYSALQHVAP